MRSRSINTFFYVNYFCGFLGSGYLLMTVKTIYSNNVFYSNDEMIARGSIINVQEIVESPELYLLGKTSDKLEEKLTYTETRMEDIVDLNTPLEIDGKVLCDELRFFTGEISINVFLWE